MEYVLGVLFALLGIALSIALHEVGHLVPAKLFGLRVPQYMIGFGPTLFSRRVGETEYGVKAVPLGGYVQMIGMYPPKPDQPEGTVRPSGRFGSMIEDARAMSLEQLQPGDEHRVFYNLPVAKKVVIMLGGPVMNLVIAVLVFGGLVTLHGVATTTPTLAAVSECVDYTRGGQSAAQECTPDMPKAPANAAGLKPGDTILSVNGAQVSTWAEVRSEIRAGGDRPMTLVIDRQGQQLTKHAQPIVMAMPVLDAQGQVVDGPDGKPLTEKVGFLGASGQVAVLRQPVSAVPGFVGEQLSATAGALTRLPAKMYTLVADLVRGDARDPESPMSVVGVGRISGDIAASDQFGTTSDKVLLLLSLIGSLNIMLFLFNLVPLLPLDGGHVAGALWEGLKKGWARLRNLPEPGPVDVAKALPLAYAVASVFIVMTVVLMYADLVNPVRITG
ncbi:M50 family metallopeptidase [Kribbia dieselivorans]|uniref:M50 family metallopeptidase n=1 Tax=Kribbia dieselivorans TaxID=331526 RepID=UPI00083893E0|nr:site-2 protease family protein [Kribbia dieselivorans]